MRRSILALAIATVALLGPLGGSAAAQSSTFTASASCSGNLAFLSGSIDPVPSTEYGLTIRSSVQGELLSLSLPGGFDITGVSLGFPLPLGVVTGTAFEDPNFDAVQDPSEATIASVTLDRPCEPHQKAECKQGGWTSPDFAWLGFKNQGDCVSYVATGGRNLPAG